MRSDIWEKKSERNVQATWERGFIRLEQIWWQKKTIEQVWRICPSVSFSTRITFYHSPCCMNPQIELFLSLGYILFCHVPSAIFFSEGSEHSMEPSPLRILQTRPIMVICRISWGFSSNSRRIWRTAPAFALSSTYKSIILHQTWFKSAIFNALHLGA